MLAKLHRLPSPEIITLMRSNRRVSSTFFVLLYKKTQNNASRFAVVVSKKIDKRAVARNRIKRLLHQALVSTLPTIGAIDGVILVKKGMPDTVSEIQHVLADIWKKI